MSCDNHDSGMSTVMAFLLGGAVGGVLGLLYAPSSGEETRRRIKFYAEEAADKVVERMQQVREDADELCAKVRDEFSEQKERLTSALDAGRRALYERSTRLRRLWVGRGYFGVRKERQRGQRS